MMGIKIFRSPKFSDAVKRNRGGGGLEKITRYVKSYALLGAY